MLSYVELTGYKSISNSQRVDFSGLTVLAGTNSSGKSSVMQPLLLLKQTVECPYDPGAILLDGPNVKFTATDQVLSKIKSKDELPSGSFKIGVGLLSREMELEFIYRRGANGGLNIDSQKVIKDGKTLVSLRESQELTGEELAPLTLGSRPLISGGLIEGIVKDRTFFFVASRERCFLKLGLALRDANGVQSFGLDFDVLGDLALSLKRMLHIPGLRGNLERTYRATQIGSQFPGTYENYVASILLMWQETGDSKLVDLGDYLRFLGLTWKVAAHKIQDTRVELKVGRLPQAERGGARDLVSLADVGLGVAQVLPILVALLSAGYDQVVYVEQPELHLHPKAQWKLAQIFRDAVNRGVRVVVETHSAIFLRGLQTEIASSKLQHSKVRLNWFTRDQKGSTLISSCTPDSNGAFGDWPADFDDVSLEAEGSYLDAVGGEGA